MTSRALFLLTALKNAFTDSRVNQCYCNDSSTEFGIIEQNNLARIVPVENTKALPCFLVTNNLQEPVHFIAIDGCFFSKSDIYTGKRNDCIIFNNADFCFIELKLNVKSKKQRSERAREAIKQLGEGIAYFKNHFQQTSQDFISFGFNYEAYIVFPFKQHPRISAQSIQRATHFLLQHGVKLYEQNEKKFAEESK